MRGRSQAAQPKIGAPVLGARRARELFREVYRAHPSEAIAGNNIRVGTTRKELHVC